MKFKNIKHFFNIFFRLVFFIPVVLWGQSGHKFSWSGHNNGITAMVITSDDKHLITADNDVIKIWNRKTEKLEKSIFGESIEDFSLSYDNQFIAFGTKSGFNVYHIPSDSIVYTEPTPERVLTLKFVPNTHTMMIAMNGDSSILHWDLLTRKILNTYRWDIKDIITIDFSADGHFMLVAGTQLTDTQVVLWDMVKSEVKHKFTGEYISKIFPKSRKIVFSTSEGITVRDFEGKVLYKVSGTLEYSAWCLDISSDEKYLVAAVNGPYPHLWDLSNGSLLRKHYIDSYVVCFSPDSKQFGYTSAAPPVFESVNGGVVSRYEGISHVEKIEQSSDYQKIFVVQDSKELGLRTSIKASLLDQKSLNLKPFWASTYEFGVDQALPSSFSKGNLFTLTDGKGRFELWNMSTRKMVRSFPTFKKYGSSRVSISPDEQIILVESSKTDSIYLFDLSGKLIQKFPRERFAPFYSAFSSSGRYLVYFCASTNSINILDIKKLNLVGSIEPSNKYMKVIFSADEKLLLT
jgi:WD40 repeat protein